jgi:hypothetical protein
MKIFNKSGQFPIRESMFETMHIQKKRETDGLASSLDSKTKDELISLLSKTMRDGTLKAADSERIVALKKELNGYDFNTDYW